MARKLTESSHNSSQPIRDPVINPTLGNIKGAVSEVDGKSQLEWKQQILRELASRPEWNALERFFGLPRFPVAGLFKGLPFLNGQLCSVGRRPWVGKTS
jgi:hypothetical protein